jgi:beta-aspartyl-peptidase (threonine type)
MNIGIAVHGGAGTMPQKLMTTEMQSACNNALKAALVAGYKIMQQGGTSIDAVEAAVVVLEDFELFNAGRGSVFTNKGLHEMDASIMDGKTLGCGAVAGVRNIRNPVCLAKKIMTQSEHIFLIGQGAEEFARQHGIAFEEDAYFFSQFRYDQLIKARENELVVLDHIDDNVLEKEKKFGTVGAVALDTNGNLAAATSTGGMTNKAYSRVGDSPIIGAGTYANNAQCAVSCTGHGEYFIQHLVAYDLFCLMEYKQYTLQQAADYLIHKKLKERTAEGGLIAIDKLGNICLPFNTPGMYRGWMKSFDEFETAIY